MKYSTVGAWRSINAAGRVTINRTARDPGVVLTADELDKRIKTGLFRIKQFQDAVANLRALRAKQATPRYVERVIVERVDGDTVTL